MGWLHSIFCPLKKFWRRIRATKSNRGGIYILYEDVKSCSCEDVHALWTLLVDSDANFT
ncbi:serine threonine- kinase yrzF [Olea europaea subsp. europaea]|uniref:Serine threonine- kinase yrzF n=1 Tax=Olea europaea subsp. europaea TaxID=158383 RepID=A0A8S0SS15_OLEEU|nr:serine threonine- kinase yrzF [Olea europaea subsp. europaea]